MKSTESLTVSVFPLIAGDLNSIESFTACWAGCLPPLMDLTLNLYLKLIFRGGYFSWKVLISAEMLLASGPGSVVGTSFSMKKSWDKQSTAEGLLVGSVSSIFFNRSNARD